MADLEKMGAREWLRENAITFAYDSASKAKCSWQDVERLMEAYADYVRRLGSAGQGEPE